MISIEPFTYESAKELCRLFQTDAILRAELNMPGKSEFSADEELLFISEWNKKNNSESFAIRYVNEFAGMISLSHIDHAKNKARVGYWVGSEFRNRGIGKKAFELIISLAESKGIKVLESDIDKNNLFSLKIWQKYNPEISEKNETQYELRLLLI
ncbi:MAG TPA: GNAT family N-acetyltransferase [Clostridiales bacterium]|nr:GNAT family N-acetyltransferase [Clostridiales bacterium]HQP69876.1 GNAT family N-acetyltransferase [Clostridiales bacterium]